MEDRCLSLKATCESQNRLGATMITLLVPDWENEELVSNRNAKVIWRRTRVKQRRELVMCLGTDERQYNSYSILEGSLRALCNARGVLDLSTAADGCKMEFTCKRDTFLNTGHAGLWLPP